MERPRDHLGIVTDIRYFRILTVVIEYQISLMMPWKHLVWVALAVLNCVYRARLATCLTIDSVARGACSSSLRMVRKQSAFGFLRRTVHAATLAATRDFRDSHAKCVCHGEPELGPGPVSWVVRAKHAGSRTCSCFVLGPRARWICRRMMPKYKPLGGGSSCLTRVCIRARASGLARCQGLCRRAASVVLQREPRAISARGGSTSSGNCCYCFVCFCLGDGLRCSMRAVRIRGKRRRPRARVRVETALRVERARFLVRVLLGLCREGILRPAAATVTRGRRFLPGLMVRWSMASGLRAGRWGGCGQAKAWMPACAQWGVRSALALGFVCYAHGLAAVFVLALAVLNFLISNSTAGTVMGCVARAAESPLGCLED